ncbi:FAD-dependent oxidoreductase [Peterkaempfera sp. SMS 1(5)a]
MAHGRPAPHHAARRGHWTGTETSTEFFGLMEGAIRSGLRAAAEDHHRLM